MSPKKRPTLFSLDTQSGVPYYKQIILQVESAIADGRLVRGTQLPTVRALAVELSINPNTVAKAYTQLETRGLLNTQQGTGTFITEKKVQKSQQEREQLLAQFVDPLINSMGTYGLTISDVILYLEEVKNLKESEK